MRVGQSKSNDHMQYGRESNVCYEPTYLGGMSGLLLQLVLLFPEGAVGGLQLLHHGSEGGHLATQLAHLRRES